MKFTDGNLYWINKNKIKYTYPYLSANKKCDVLIVGGGVTGALMSYYLAKEGLSVIIVDKNIIGYGSTSAATALLEYQNNMDLNKLNKIIGEKKAKRCYSLCLESIYDIQNIVEEMNQNCEFKLKDSLYFSNKLMDKSYIYKEYEERKKAGFNPQMIENGGLIDMRYGILTKNAGAEINPYMFTQELFNYVSQMPNVEIFENTNITKCNTYEDRVECSTNNYFKIYSSKIVFASGFEALKYLEYPDTNMYKTFTIVTKPIDVLSNYNLDFVAKDMIAPYHYFRFTNDNRIMFSGENIKLNDRVYNDKIFKNIANDKYKKLYDSMQKTLTTLDDIDIEYCYNGTIGITKDMLPIIDELPNMPNAFCCLGFGGNGILFGNIGGRMLKDAVKGYYTKDMQMFKFDR